MTNEWTPPAVGVPASNQAPRRRRGVVVGSGLIATGVVAGAIVGSTLLSNAAAPSTTTPSTGSSAPSRAHPHRGAGLDLNGVVTAVGTSSVDIKSGTAAPKTYTVTSGSDIDKNGEATLSSLKVGDAVTFSVSAANTIDILHAGTEALDRPRGDPHGGDNGR